jgi:hypothetical protein
MISGKELYHITFLAENPTLNAELTKLMALYPDTIKSLWD